MKPASREAFKRIRIFALLAIALACRHARACQIIVQTTMALSEGAIALQRSQIIHLAKWMADVRVQFSKLEDVYVEAGASDAAPWRAKQLARQRAVSTEQALRSFLPFGTRIEKREVGYRETRVAMDGGNDYVMVQLNPDFKGSGVKDCNALTNSSLEGAARGLPVQQ